MATTGEILGYMCLGGYAVRGDSSCARRILSTTLWTMRRVPSAYPEAVGGLSGSHREKKRATSTHTDGSTRKRRRQSLLPHNSNMPHIHAEWPCDTGCRCGSARRPTFQSDPTASHQGPVRPTWLDTTPGDKTTTPTHNAQAPMPPERWDYTCPGLHHPVTWR